MLIPDLLGSFPIKAGTITTAETSKWRREIERERNDGIFTFNDLFSPPYSASNNADNEELPTGIHQAFKDIIDMDKLVLAVKSLSSDKASGSEQNLLSLAWHASQYLSV
jgi:hypothetical protein